MDPEDPDIMSDGDIDIEEHDVMASAQYMYPDLTIVKSEVLDDDEDPSHETWDQNLDEFVESPLVEINNADSTTDITNVNSLRQSSESPKVSSSYDSNSDLPFFGNMIILGKKAPKDLQNLLAIGNESKTTADEELFRGDVRKEYLETTVVIEDWGPFLENSKLYCIECLTLFPTENALDYHKMAVHSYLVAIDEPLESVTNKPAKPHLSINNKIEPTLEDHNVCFVCQEVVQTKDELISHLYKHHLEANKTTSSSNDVVNGARAKTAVKLQNATEKPEVKPNVLSKLSCQHCAMKFNNNKLYKQHLLLEHRHNKTKSKVISSKKSIIRPNPSAETNSLPKTRSTKFKCKICLKIYNYYSSCYSHINRQHGKSLPVNYILILERNYVDNTINNQIIPRGIVYQCTKCNVNFLKPCTGFAHMETCNKSKSKLASNVSCSSCNLYFSLSTLKKHQQQHTFADKFVALPVSLELRHRLLSGCPRCKVYFIESKFTSHFSTCGRVPVKMFLCNICKIKVDAGVLDAHMQCHRRLNSVPQDFIKIEYDLLEPKAPTEDDKFSCYYCEKCDSYGAYCADRRVVHLNGSACHTIANKICHECGLNFTAKSKTYHNSLHLSAQKKLTLDNFTIHRLVDKEIIEPPVPKYPQCIKCKVQFLSAEHVQSHRCYTFATRTCDVCHVDLSEEAHPLHMAFHYYRKQRVSNVEVDPDQAKMLERYDTLQETWNVLFLCIGCNFILDNYSDVVEHCQKHFNNEAMSGVLTTKCLVCHITFEETCYRKHIELHKNNSKLTRQSFNILEFDYESMLNVNWAKELFASLSDMCVEQLTRDSVHRHFRNVKLEVKQWGRPHLTMYQCDRCETIVQPEEVAAHTVKYQDGDCRIKFHRRCPQCQLSFIGNVWYLAHLELHKQQTFTAELCRIVKFNKQEDFDFNSALLKDYDDGLDDTRKKITFFKCVNCEVVLLNKKSLSTHLLSSNCKTLRRKYIKCKICGLLVAPRGNLRHTFIHKKYGKKHFKIVLFGGNSVKLPRQTDVKQKLIEVPIHEDNAVKAVDNGKKKYIIYKCSDCQRCVISASRLYKHSCHKKHSVRKCQKCSLIFNKIVYNTHMKKHGKCQDFHLENINIVPFKPKKEQDLFQCKRCHINLSTMQSVMQHGAVCGTIPAYECKYCVLQFPLEKKGYHTKMHKAKGLFRLNFKIIIFGDSSEVVRTSDSDRKFLYSQCQKCFVIFASKLHATKHMEKCNGTSQKVTCKICHYDVPWLQFTNHDQEHKRYPEMTRDNIQLIKISPNLPDRDNWNMYTCRICKISMNKWTHYKHMQLKNCAEMIKKRVWCRLCHLWFYHDLRVHNLAHKTYPIMKKDNIKIVYFNTKKEELNKDVKSKRKYILYKCKVCKICIHNRKSINNHRLYGCKKETFKCRYCGYFFSKASIGSDRLHMRNHKELDDYTKANIKIMLFGGDDIESEAEHDVKVRPMKRKRDESSPEPSQPKIKVTIFQCKECKACYLHERTYKRHASMCKSMTTVLKKCDSCNLSFPENTFENHKYNHHIVNKYKADDFNISSGTMTEMLENKNDSDDRIHSENVPNSINKDPQSISKVLYKCEICDVYCLTKNTVWHHLKVRHDKCMYKQTMICQICGLKFSLSSHKRHMHYHHEILKLNLADFEIVTSVSAVRTFNGDLLSVEENSDIETKRVSEYRSQDTEVVE